MKHSKNGTAKPSVKRTPRGPSPPLVNGASPGSKPPVTEGPASGRDPATGKFLKGNAGGPGNPFMRRMGALRKAFYDATTEDEVKAVALKLAEMAKAGDLEAARLFLSYAVGPPPSEAADPDRLDLHELELLEDFPSEGDLYSLWGVSPELALLLARIKLRVAAEGVVGRELGSPGFGANIEAGLREAGLGELIEAAKERERQCEENSRRIEADEAARAAAAKGKGEDPALDGPGVEALDGLDGLDVATLDALMQKKIKDLARKLDTLTKKV
jgi:hypothetical protein